MTYCCGNTIPQLHGNIFNNPPSKSLALSLCLSQLLPPQGIPPKPPFINALVYPHFSPVKQEQRNIRRDRGKTKKKWSILDHRRSYMVEDRSQPLDLRDMRALSVLGRGAKGVVFLVRTNSSDQNLALKAISRSTAQKKQGQAYGCGDGYRRIWFERDVLKSLRHPLLPELRGFVSTDKIVGFAMDQCSGGDLNALRKKQTEKMFSDDVIRFYAAELVLALEHLHGMGIVYRDLKPENVLIQDSGHLMLVDFDLSTKLSTKPSNSSSTASDGSETRQEKSNKRSRFPSLCSCSAGVSPESSDSVEENGGGVSSPDSSVKSNSFVGTEEYVAPEIILGNGHDFAVDWWSLGVVLYEMLYGRTPFRGQHRKETFYRILSTSPELAGERMPLRDLLGRLLEKDPGKRISCDSIKGHEFFRGMDWEAIMLISRPPFIPAGAFAGEESRRTEEGEEEESIDVEKFVHGIFGIADIGEEKIADKGLVGNRIPSTTADFLDF